MKDILTRGLEALSLPIDSVPQLEQYASLLLEQNRYMNLTAITNPEQVARLHMADSAALLHAADFSGKRVLDVGTGAGFPGLVLRLIEPSISLTLLDSLGKRISWLQQIAPELGAADVTAIHGRAEELARSAEFREQFDIVTSRAVADLGTLCELCLPFLRPGGVFLAMKGPDCREEKNAAGRCISILGGQLRQDYVYTIPETEVTHCVVRVEKTRPTPAKYPRRFAQIKKSPL